MNRREFVISTMGVAVALAAPARVFVQNKTIEPDLGALADGKGINPSNRTITRITDGARIDIFDRQEDLLYLVARSINLARVEHHYAPAD